MKNNVSEPLLPSYFLQQPAADWGTDTLAAFEKLYMNAIAPGTGAAINYTLPAPKWQFLCWLCENHAIVLHGSGNPDITEFEPRQSNDVNEFGNRRAVYAASDGIWPLYFAIVNRSVVTSLVNACFRVADGDTPSNSYYFFSVNGDALPRQPWRNGTIYILPSATFERQARQIYRGLEIDHAQWASLVSVRPLAKLVVQPQDFPFLAQIYPHDPALIGERAQANPDGFPWIEEL